MSGNFIYSIKESLEWKRLRTLGLKLCFKHPERLIFCLLLILVVYLMVTMTLGTVSICVTVFVLNVHHSHPSGRPRLWLRHLVLLHIARLLRMTTSYTPRRPHNQPNATEQVWKRRPGFEPARRRNNFQMNGNVAIRTDKSRPKNHMKTLHPVCGQRLKDYFARTLLPRRQPVDSSPALLAKSSHIGSDHLGTAPKDYSAEWRELAQVLDRLFFWVICLLMTSSTIFILLYPKYSGVEDGW